MPKTEDLTEKQKIFCREYIYDWNGTRAAKAAGYSEKTAAEIASENLRKPQIQAFIKAIQSDLEKTAGISRLMLAREHKKIIDNSIAHLHTDWITRKEFDKLTDDQKSCISEISTQIRKVMDYTENPENPKPVEIEFVKIKLYDKQKAIDSLSRLLGYDIEKIELSGGIKSYKIVGARGRRAGDTGQ